MRALMAVLALGVSPQALADGAGFLIGPLLVEQGDGQHLLQPAGGLWWRADPGERLCVEVEGMASRRVVGDSPVSFDQRWARGALTVGLRFGQGETELTAGLGPSVTFQETLVEAEERWRGSAITPGLRMAIGVHLPDWRGWGAAITAGASTRRWAVDQEMVARLGRRWG